MRAAAGDLVTERYSAAVDQTVRLADGRQLGFASFGDADGIPMFYLHGSFGSRLEGRLTHPSALHRHVRVIAPDRPGFGLSHQRPNARAAPLRGRPDGARRSARPRPLLDDGRRERRTLRARLRPPARQPAARAGADQQHGAARSAGRALRHGSPRAAHAPHPAAPAALAGAAPPGAGRSAGGSRPGGPAAPGDRHPAQLGARLARVARDRPDLHGRRLRGLPLGRAGRRRRAAAPGRAVGASRSSRSRRRCSCGTARRIA